MTAVHIIVGGTLGLFVAAIVGVVYTVAVGGIEKGEGDPREYVVSAILFAGMFIGLVAGWRL